VVRGAQPEQLVAQLAKVQPAKSVAPPVRTCVGCRQRASSSELLRVVAVETGTDQFSVRPDPRRVMPGRGAHLHPAKACLESALRRRAFGRALRVVGVIDVDTLTGAIHES